MRLLCADECCAVPCAVPCVVMCRAVPCKCCAVLCCAVLCCAVLCCAVLCCAVLCCAALRRSVPCSGISLVAPAPPFKSRLLTAGMRHPLVRGLAAWLPPRLRPALRSWGAVVKVH